MARQAILYERRLPCDSPEGRLICDEIVPPAHGRGYRPGVEGMTSSGAVGAIGNRRAFRVGQEPLDSSVATARSLRANRPIAISAQR